MRTIPSGAQTLYELAAHHPDGRRVLICYTGRKGRRDIWYAITSDKRRDALCRFFGDSAITWGKRVADGLIWGGWSVRFTGRTQREAIRSELPYAPDLVEAAA